MVNVLWLWLLVSSEISTLPIEEVHMAPRGKFMRNQPQPIVGFEIDGSKSRRNSFEGTSLGGSSHF